MKVTVASLSLQVPENMTDAEMDQNVSGEDNGKVEAMDTEI